MGWGVGDRGWGGGGPKIDEKMIFSEWVPLVGKMIPDPAGVFCGIPGPPSCHIAQKSKFVFFFVFA